MPLGKQTGSFTAKSLVQIGVDEFDFLNERHMGYDPDEQQVVHGNLVYDIDLPDGPGWVRMEQPVIKTDVLNVTLDAVKLKNPSGTLVGDQASPLAVSVNDGSISAKAADATSVGDNTVHTPATGKRIKLFYFSLSASSANENSILTTLKLGAGATRYKEDLAAGVIFSRNVASGRKFLLGDIDEPLMVDLGGEGTVYVSIEYEEV